MKVIFLDCDGVLNFKGCRARSPKGYKGIADSRLKLLKEIVDATDAHIVLTSTWKDGWYMDKVNIADPDVLYLMKKFRGQGIKIFDKTMEDSWMNRGQGIYSWLALHDEVTEWVVLDDEIFPDFEQYGILEHLVQTEYSAADGGGLQQRHVAQVIKLLNEGIWGEHQE